MLNLIIVGVVAFLLGVVFAEAVRAWFSREETSLHLKLDRILHKLDPNATQPPH